MSFGDEIADDGCQIANLPQKGCLRPKENLSPDEQEDILHTGMIDAAVHGPCLHGTWKPKIKKDSENWQFDNAATFDRYRGDLLNLLDNLRSSDRKQIVLQALCEHRLWKATNCRVCPDVPDGESFPEHVTSDGHLINLASKDCYPTISDFKVLETVLTHAKWCTSVNELRLPFEKAEDFDDGDRPLLEIVLDPHLKQMRETIKKYTSPNSVEMAWKIMFPKDEKTSCSTCKINWSADGTHNLASKYLNHVLSDDHIQACSAIATGKYFYRKDKDVMFDLVMLSKNLYWRVDDVDPVIVDDDNVAPPPFLKGHDPKEVKEEDRMSKEEFSTFASKYDDEALMLTAKQLAIGGYKVRKIHCTTCGSKYFAEKMTLFIHILSVTHFEMVTDGGRVFSRSLDANVFTAAFDRAARISAKSKEKMEARMAALR